MKNNHVRGILCVVGVNLIAGLSFLTTIFAGLFLVPMCEKIGCDYSDVAIMFTTMTIGCLVGYMFLGKAFEKMNPKFIFLIGSLACLIGVSGLAFITSPIQVILLYFFVGFLMTFASTGALSIVCSQWVGAGRGTVIGMCTIVTAVLGMIFSPLAAVWINRYGLEKTAIVSGIVLFLVSAVLSLLTISRTPEYYGAKPMDIAFLAKREQKKSGQPVREVDLSAAQARKLPVFWELFLYVALVSFVMNGFYSNRTGAFSEIGCSLVQLGTLTGVYTVVAAVVVVLFGLLCDKGGYRIPMIAFTIIGAVIYLMWPGLKSMGFAGAMLICIFANVGQIATYLGPNVFLPMFGEKSAPALISAAQIAATVGGILAPIVIAALPSYDAFFLLGGIFFAVSVVLAILACGRHAAESVSRAAREEQDASPEGQNA